MRTVVSIAALLAFSFTAIPPLCASSATSNESVAPDQQTLDALEARIAQAQPREQCFLYAQLLQQKTELSIRQYQSGNVSRATG